MQVCILQYIVMNTTYIDLSDTTTVHKIDCEIKFTKTHPNATLPTKGHHDDNCWDLYCVEETTIPSTTSNGISSKVVPVGLSVAHITPGFGFVIRGRSGLGFKHSLMPHFGEIDNGYRGDIGVKMYNLSNESYTFKPGDRVAQIKIERVYEVNLDWTEEATESSRGARGHGSTGK